MRGPRLRWQTLPWPLLALVLGVLAQDVPTTIAARDSDAALLKSTPPDYAPNVNQTCPDVSTAPLIRVFSPANQTLHPEEEAYVSERLSGAIVDALANWIGGGQEIGYDLKKFNMSASAPRIGIGISGGGYRAAQYGAGVLSALDARNESAKSAGTGGLLQVASYISGLSGEPT